MKLIFRLIIQMTLITKCICTTYIKYDTGNVSLLAWGAGSSCYQANGFSSYSSTIIFNGIFANTPQLLTFINHYDLQRGLTEFTYFISDINQESIFVLKSIDCTISVECLQSNALYTLIILWVAIDDDRILILNQFNVNVTDQVTQSFTIPHDLSDVAVGFLALTDWGFKGNIAYSLQVIKNNIRITSITSSEVNIQFAQENTNLISIGFQVVLGTEEAFSVSPIFQMTFPVNDQISQSLTKPQGHKLFLPFAGCTWTITSKNFRIRLNWEDTDSITTYTYVTWSGTGYDKFNYQEVWFNFQNSKVRVPFLCQKWRVSRKQDFPGSRAQLYIKEKDQYFQIGYQDSIILDDTYNILNIVASFRCSSVQKVIGSILSCIDCQKQTLDIQSLCYGGMNLLEHHIKLTQNDQVYQKLTITITSTSITIEQSVIGNYGTVLQLQLVRQ